TCTVDPPGDGRDRRSVGRLTGRDKATGRGPAMAISVPDAAADAIVRALYTVASGGGTEPLSEADRRGIRGAHRTVLGRDGAVDPDQLTVIEPAELAEAVTDGDARLDTLRMAAVMAIVDAVIDDEKLQAVL